MHRHAPPAALADMLDATHAVIKGTSCAAAAATPNHAVKPAPLVCSAISQRNCRIGRPCSRACAICERGGGMMAARAYLCRYSRPYIPTDVAPAGAVHTPLPSTLQIMPVPSLSTAPSSFRHHTFYGRHCPTLLMQAPADTHVALRSDSACAAVAAVRPGYIARAAHMGHRVRNKRSKCAAALPLARVHRAAAWAAAPGSAAACLHLVLLQRRHGQRLRACWRRSDGLPLSSYHSFTNFTLHKRGL